MTHLAVGDRVRVHLNLHRGDFSVGDPKTGLIIDNVDTITLRSVTFRVQPSMLLKIQMSKRRKVCAYAIGIIDSLDDDGQRSERISFNPFRSDTFECAGEPIHTADRVVFAGRYAYLSGGETTVTSK